MINNSTEHFASISDGNRKNEKRGIKYNKNKSPEAALFELDGTNTFWTRKQPQ